MEALDSIIMSTARNEKYKCTLPKPQEHSKVKEIILITVIRVVLVG